MVYGHCAPGRTPAPRPDELEFERERQMSRPARRYSAGGPLHSVGTPLERLCREIVSDMLTSTQNSGSRIGETPSRHDQVLAAISTILAERLWWSGAVQRYLLSRSCTALPVRLRELPTDPPSD